MAAKHAQLARWEDDLLPHVVDRLGEVASEKPYAEYPLSTVSYDDGFLVVTYRDLANAVNRLAHWLQETLGAPSNLPRVIAYMGPNDLRYSALILAANKAGFLLFLTSPRNSLFAHGELFKVLSCEALLSPDPKPPMVDPILDHTKVQHFTVPSVSQILEPGCPKFEYEKHYNTARWDPFVVVHTSGSTGVPKPLTWTNETVVRLIRMGMKSACEGEYSVDALHQGKRILNAFPPFHAAGLACHFTWAIPFGSILITPLSGGMITGDSLVKALGKTKVQIGLFVPSLIAEIGQRPDLLEACASHLELILFMGGDLPQPIGDVVAEKVRLHCQYGASEIGIAPQLLHPELQRSDWHYIQLHSCLGAEFQYLTEDLFELVVKHNGENLPTQPTFSQLPELYKLHEYRTRDLFSPHPRLGDLWQWRARADDIIVFLNGEKTNPISMEQSIAAKNQQVAAALVIGAQRFQAALLIEPKDKEKIWAPEERAKFIEIIWPSVQEANKLSPAHAQVEKAMILLTDPAEPMIRSGKGTIQRAATVALYSKRLDRLYADLDNNSASASNGVAISTSLVPRAVASERIRESLTAILDVSSYTDDDDFFLLGLDSLKSMQLLRALKRSLYSPNLALSTIYSNPSVSELADNLSSSANHSTPSHEDIMRKMLKEFRGRVKQIPAPIANPLIPEAQSVVLTGSTGGLGTFLLRTLLRCTSVARIFCLNRRPDSYDIYLKRVGSTQRIDTDDARTSFLQVDFAKSKFGLDEEIYTKLGRDITLIIHSAWPLNFNLSLASFRPQLEGLLNVFQLSASSPCRPRLFYTSSVSSIMGLSGGTEPVAEKIVTSVDASARNGYAGSKLLSEILCLEASQQLGIAVDVARVAQIAGPIATPGLWNPLEWFPSLVISSVRLKAFPAKLGTNLSRVDWVPIDLLADSIIELTLGAKARSLEAHEAWSGECSVYHLSNPHPTSWAALLPIFAFELKSQCGIDAKVISSSEWLALVQQDLEGVMQSGELESSTLDRNPAARLLDFYRVAMADDLDRPGLSNASAVGRSSKLRNMANVNGEWIRKWVSEWTSHQSRAGGAGF